MLEFIGTVIWIILLLLLGAGSIRFAVEDYKKRRYFLFGLNIMWAVMDTLLIAASMFKFLI